MLLETVAVLAAQAAALAQTLAIAAVWVHPAKVMLGVAQAAVSLVLVAEVRAVSAPTPLAVGPRRVSVLWALTA